MLSGLLNLNKPTGVSSRAVVNQVQRLVRPAKVGHAGTLDPLATGVLVTCVGAATRLTDYLHRMPKRYRATFQLGFESDSEDIETDLRALSDARRPTRFEIEAVLPEFLGAIHQVPPRFSAIKVQGKRAYRLARRGDEVELAPRVIQIHRLEVASYDYPDLVLDIDCGTGTYVRSLGRDLAVRLGTGAVMSALTRLAIGPFRVEEALDPDQLAPETIGAALYPLTAAVPMLPRIELDDQEVARVARGMVVCRDPLVTDVSSTDRDSASPARLLKDPRSDASGCESAAVDGRGRLVAILVETPRGLQPHRVFVS